MNNENIRNHYDAFERIEAFGVMAEWATASHIVRVHRNNDESPTPRKTEPGGSG